MKNSDPIFKLPASWKKPKPSVELAPVSTKKEPAVIDARYEVIEPDHRVKNPAPGVEERIIAYHTKMARLELEEIKIKEELESRRLNMNYDKLDNMNLEGVFNGETAHVPKRRK